MKDEPESWGSAFRGQLREILADRGVMLILLGAVLVYGLFYPLPYLNEQIRETPVAVIDRDNSSLSRELTRMARAHEYLKVVAVSADSAQAETWLRQGRIGGYMIIPTNFARDLKRGSSPVVVVAGDASYFLINRQVLTGFSEVNGFLAAGVTARRQMAKGLSSAAAESRVKGLPVVMRPLFNVREGYLSYILPAALVLVLQQTLLIGTGMLGGTRRERLLGSKQCSAVVKYGWRSWIACVLLLTLLYLLHAGIYFGHLLLWTDVPHQWFWVNSLALLVPFILSVALLGWSLCLFWNTREQALPCVLLSSLPLLFLAGFAWPVEAMPGLLTHLAVLAPSSSAIPGLLAIHQMEASLAEVRVYILRLWALCFLYAPFAWAGWKRAIQTDTNAQQRITV